MADKSVSPRQPVLAPRGKISIYYCECACLNGRENHSILQGAPAMGAAYYILLENEIPGLDTMMSGEPIARADAALELAALQSGVRPLMEFYSTNAEELADILGEEEEVPEVGPEVWFPAAEGLLTVRALIAVADRNPELAPVMDDLQDMQRILVEAEKHNVRWHLAIDI